MGLGAVPMESLPLGFRFRPTDEELISHYLRLKINGRDSEVQVIPEVDVCKWEPWDLPGLSVIKADDPEWFFFCPRDRKYPNGHRSNRATDAGYWKATGKDRTIKSRKQSLASGRLNPQLIGMKKTLVFYRGRAPKGERTHWIMHEYRATEPDVDGTGPGQGAYVLCRLFRKPEEKAEVVKHDEVDPTGSSPTTSKSSPDDTSSDLYQETLMPDVQHRKQTEGIKKWLIDKSDNVKPSVVVPVESCTSDVDDKTATEVSRPPGGDSMFYEPTVSQIDGDIVSPLHWPIDNDLAFMDSPFADDFGNDICGFHFRDGTCEEDVSFADMMKVFRNHDNYSCEESTSQKNSTVGSETQMPGQIDLSPHGPFRKFSVEDKVFFGMTDANMTGLQMESPRSSPVQTSYSNPELRVHNMGGVCDDSNNMGAVCDDSIGQNATVNNISYVGAFNISNESVVLANPVSDGHEIVGQTGIKIITRQPRNQPSSQNLVLQGIAPRRIRLQMHVSPPDSVCCSNTESSIIDGKDEQEAKSNIHEASGDTKFEQAGDESNEISLCSQGREVAGETNKGLRLRRKDGVTSTTTVGSSVSFSPSAQWVTSLLLVGISLVIVLFVMFIGVRRCLSVFAVDV